MVRIKVVTVAGYGSPAGLGATRSATGQIVE
jgi:hypothetical protein